MPLLDSIAGYFGFVRRPPAEAPRPLSPAARLREKVAGYQAAGVPLFLPWLGSCDAPWLPRRVRDAVLLAMRHHPVVKPAVLGKLFSVTSLDLQSTPASEDARDGEIAEFARYQFGQVLTVPEVGMEVLYPALILRQSVCELVWHEELWGRGRWRGKRFYKAVKAKAGAELLRDEFGNPVGVRGRAPDGEEKDFPLDGFLHFENLELFGDGGTSDFLPVYQDVVAYETLQTLRDIHLDKYVSPTLVARYPHARPMEGLDPGQSSDQAWADVIEPQLAQLKARGYLVLPDDVLLEAMSMAVRGEAEYLAALQHKEQKIVTAVAGAFLQMLTSPGVAGDQKGDSRVQSGTAQLFVWALSSSFCAALNRQAVPPLVRENYGGQADYPTLSLGGVNYAEMNALADLYGKAVLAGARPSRRAYAKAVGVQLATEPGDELTGPPPPAPAAPGGGPALPFRGGAAGGAPRRPAP